MRNCLQKLKTCFYGRPTPDFLVRKKGENGGRFCKFIQFGHPFCGLITTPCFKLIQID